MFARVSCSRVNLILCTPPLVFSIFSVRHFPALILKIADVSAIKVGPSAPKNPFGDGLGNAAPLGVCNFGGVSLVTYELYRVLGKFLVSESVIRDVEVKVGNNVGVDINSAIWDVKVEFNDEVNGDIEGNGNTTKTNRNTGPYPTMAVVSRRVMTNLLVKLC